jgi:uncharacterized membrane protein YccC
MKRFIYHLSLLYALQTTLAMSVAFVVGGYFPTESPVDTSFLGGLWCAVSAVIASEPRLEHTRKSSWLRFIGSLYGCLVGGILATLFGYKLIVLVLSCFLVVVLVSISRLFFAVKLATATVLIIFAVGIQEPCFIPWENASLRFFESAIGILIAIFFAALFYPLRKGLKRFYPPNM